MPASCLEPALPEAPLEAELSDDSMETLSLNAESLSGLSVRAVIEVFEFVTTYLQKYMKHHWNEIVNTKFADFLLLFFRW